MGPQFPLRPLGGLEEFPLGGPVSGAGSALDQVAAVAVRWLAVPYVLIHLGDNAPTGSAILGRHHDWSEEDLAVYEDTFAGEEALVAADLSREARFRDCPLVTDGPGLRFCALVPLLDGDTRLGSLAIFDTHPRLTGELELDALRELAELATRTLRTSREGGAPAGMLDAGTNRYRELFENATDIVYMHDLRGNLTAINRAAERLTGYSRSELLDMNITDLAGARHRETVRQMLLEQFGSGQSQSYELSFRTRSHQSIDVEVSVHLLFQGGQPVGLLGFARNITGQRRERRAREKLERKLQKTSRRLDELSGLLAGKELGAGRETGAELALALKNRELDLRFQPQYRRDGSLRGLEALLVWNHPERGLLPAGHFVPEAEESGLIVPIGAWVLREACRRLAGWAKTHRGRIRIAVNVAAIQFEQPDFVDLVAATLAANQLDAERLELEITESAAMRDAEASSRTMHRLRELGVSLAVDDFGTGYSSLAYLARLPVNCLKIDRSFLNGDTPHQRVQPMIAAIVTLAHNLNLSVVGEGVETLEHFRLVEEAGCDSFQGHLFGYPASQAEAAHLLARHYSFCQLPWNSLL